MGGDDGGGASVNGGGDGAAVDSTGDVSYGSDDVVMASKHLTPA